MTNIRDEIDKVKSLFDYICPFEYVFASAVPAFSLRTASHLTNIQMQTIHLLSLSISVGLFAAANPDGSTVSTPVPVIVDFAASSVVSVSLRGAPSAPVDGLIEYLIDFADHDSAKKSADLSIVQGLIDAKADVNERGMDGWTPLICASLIDDASLTQALVDAKADVNAQDVRGNTA